MSEPTPDSTPSTGPTPGPTRRDRTRPVELLAISAVIGVAIGVIVFFSTHTLLTAAEFAGVAFIVSLVVFAMLLLAVSPPRSSSGDDDTRSSGH